jgi:hypothetical protein
MSEFQLTHIALVGARMDAFQGRVIASRNDLKSRRIPPQEDPTRSTDWRAGIAAELPLWVHNIITDPEFPGRERLLMPLRRFEGELRDKKDNEVISAVMAAGFRSQNFNPLDLPKTMPLRRRCSMVAQIGIWQEAYQRLEDDIVSILSEDAAAVASWCEQARQPENAVVELAEV